MIAPLTVFLKSEKDYCPRDMIIAKNRHIFGTFWSINYIKTE